MDQDTVNKIINNKLQALENQYNLCHKYDQAQPQHNNQQQKSQDSANQNQNQYQQLNDQQSDQHSQKPQIPKTNQQPLFQQNNWVHPRDRNIDSQKIKQLINKIQLPSPPWINNPQICKQKFNFMFS